MRIINMADERVSLGKHISWERQAERWRREMPEG